MINGNDFLTITDIAKIFDISRQTVDGWLTDRRFKFYNLGNTRRIRPEDFIEYLENLGNDRFSMANFRACIYRCLYSKYNREEYLEEANKQSALCIKYKSEDKRIFKVHRGRK